jgi:NACHT domain
MNSMALQSAPAVASSFTPDFTGRAWVFDRINQWLVNPDAPTRFLLSGGPGSGKTAIADRLVRMSQGSVSGENYPRLGPGSLTFYHFCQAFNDSSLDPLDFVITLSLQLARRFPHFAEVLASVRQPHITINAQQEIGTAAPGSDVRNVVIKELHVSNLSARIAFSHLVREPLEALCAQQPTEHILILIDSLDEALTYDSHENIVSLLETNRDLPRQVRFLLTSRPDDQVKSSIGEPSLDLIADAPDDLSDVRAYALRRLVGVPEPKRSQWADQLAAKANGIFLYARYVLDDILAHIDRVQSLDELALPADLQDQYRQYLRRELARTVAQWKRDYRPVMGVLSIARSNGLTLPQIAGATRRAESRVDQVLSVCDQYLIAPSNQGPFRIYHASFREFLIKDDTYKVFPGEANQALAAYLLKCYGRSWQDCRDDYALLYAPAHLADAVRQNEQPTRHKEAVHLAQLVLDDGFQTRIQDRFADLAAIEHNLELALRTIVVDSDPGAIPLTVATALALVQFRHKRLRPESLFELSAAGKLREAEGMLSLFGAESRWRQAALLTSAWLAAGADPNGAHALYERVAVSLDDTWPLSLLRDRVRGTMYGPDPALPGLPASPPDELARQIVARIGGQEGGEYHVAEHVAALAPAPSEALRAAIGAMPDELPLFLAEQDGPLLVAYALAHPEAGDVLFDQYVTLHAANAYTHYRNLSLWILLDAVLRHPDDRWACRQCHMLIAAALAGERLIFQEGIRYVLLMLQQMSGQPAANIAVAGLYEDLVGGMVDYHRISDPWALRKRRHMALAAACHLDQRRALAASDLLSSAYDIVSGFAGYFAPAWLTLAETIHICQPADRQDIEQCLQRALHAAHNVQEPVFCAVSTARVNALRLRWWSDAGRAPAVEEAILDLCQSPEGPNAAALHVVGEQYSLRERGPDKLPLPSLMYNAQTLRALADVYRQPLAELLRLNMTAGWGPEDILPEGTQVRIPDPGFVPLLAAYLSAAVLAESKVSDTRRAELIQILVPNSVANPTALDTVLARLLIAARPTDKQTLAALTSALDTYVIEKPIERSVTDRQIGVIVSQSMHIDLVEPGGAVTGIAIGCGDQATVTAGISGLDLDRLFQPLMETLRQAPSAQQAQAVAAAEQLKDELAKGAKADDSRVARLVDGLVGLVPSAASSVVSLFASPILGGIVGPVTKFVLERIQGT